MGRSHRLLIVGVLILMGLWTPPVPAASDRSSLATLLAEAGLAVPSQLFPAPSFSVPDLAGGTVDLHALRGRVVLLYFWTTW